MIIDSFERACEAAQRDADRRQEAHVVTRWPDDSGYHVERLAHATRDEVVFTAEPDPAKAPRKFWKLVALVAVALVGSEEHVARSEREIHARAAELRRDRRNSVKVTRRVVKADHASVEILVLTCRLKPVP
jgi:sugar/nucleoside kinase (ribokinase family)